VASDADSEDVPHPRQTTALYGHADAERTLLEAYRSGRIPHAWLIGGPPGIGKATLAYRMARFALAHPDPAAPAVAQASSLALETDHPVVRRVAAQGHGDLLVLERTEGENGKLRTVITVDQVRRTVSFFGSTAGEGGWRICIVDTADELQSPQGANALLKILEEPPQDALLLLVSHAPAQLLPTIRSRCRMLQLRPLAAQDVAKAAAKALARDPDEPEVQQVAAIGDGSVGRALALLDGAALALRQRVLDLLAQLPDPNPRDLHALGDALAGTEPRILAAFVDTIDAWLTARLSQGTREDAHRMVRAAEAWEKVNRAAHDVDEFNLERKPFVFAVFGWLAEAARG
jgi:DNA polymerase-3 subunit delta'